MDPPNYLVMVKRQSKAFFQKTPTDAPKNQPSIAMFFKKTPTPTFGTPKWTADLSKSPILRKPLSP